MHRQHQVGPETDNRLLLALKGDALTLGGLASMGMSAVQGHEPLSHSGQLRLPAHFADHERCLRPPQIRID